MSVVPASISILLGNGNGGFAIGQTTTLAINVGIRMMTIGDFNVDGEVDVVLAVSGNDLASDGAVVLLGNGTVACANRTTLANAVSKPKP